MSLNLVYRAYRAPYDWVPQLPAPRSVPVQRLDNTRFRVPGAAAPGRDREIAMPGVLPEQRAAVFCVPTSGER